MANLVELFDNIVQMQNLNGVPLAAGKLYVYALGRTRLMDTWSDVDGESLNPNPIILDDAGQAHVYVSDDFDYTLVVCDQYNNEIFSLDKYLYSKGSHSHADVAVAPSESIAVSSYHVGETTVYVPYLTGQLGKVYEGIDPIVVNNQVDKISANHVPLGVQDPLYFVQDDEEGCIIGCSAQTEIPADLSGKWDNASDVVIANSAQWAEGTTYEAGSYVDIDGHTISVTGLQPAGNYQSAGDYVVHDELSSYATQTWVNEQGFLTAHQSLDGLMSADLLEFSGSVITAYSGHKFAGEISGDPGDPEVNALVHANSATWNTVSNKLDTTAFSTVSGSFLTAHQSLDGLMSADLLEISDNKITGYNGTAFAGQGGSVSGDFELSAGSGISIVDYPLEQKTVISVTAQGGNPEVEQAVINNSATWNTVTSKADVTAIPSTAGLATENWVTSQGYLTGVDLTPYQTTAGMTAYMSTADSANFYTTANESGFVTSGELPDPITIGVQEGETLDTDYDGLKIVKATANGNEHINLHKKSTDQWLIHGGLVPTSPGSNKYLVTDDSGAMHWDNKSALAYDSAFEQSGGYITAYNGSAFKAGGELPSGVMNESALEYDTSGNISAYSGSAFATQLPEEEEVEFEEINISGISAATDYVSANSANINATVTNVSANSGAWGGSALQISAGVGIALNLVDGVLVISTAGV